MVIAAVLLAALGPRILQRAFDPFEPIVLFAVVYGAMFVIRPSAMLTRGDLVYEGPRTTLDITATYTKMLVVGLVEAIGFVAGYLSPAGPGLRAERRRPRGRETSASQALSRSFCGGRARPDGPSSPLSTVDSILDSLPGSGPDAPGSLLLFVYPRPMNQRPSHTRRWYPEVRFGGFTNVDGTVAFYTRVNSVLDPSFVVLDLGCGRGAAAFDPVPWRRALRQLKRRCDRVIGADVDPTAATNPFIDDFHLIEEGRIALPDGCVDVCVSDSVVEHVENVDSFFSECARVLRSGGYLFIRTPNVWGYPAIASRVVPHRFHAALVRRTQEDVFPTVYRCNSRRKLRRTLERHGFDSVVQAVEAEPGYLSFSSFLYALGVLHQRYAPSALRDMLFAYARKRGP